MDSLAWFVRFALSAVFFAAGLAKLAGLAGTRVMLREFRVPEWLIIPLQILLPFAELAIAASLLAPSLAQRGAWAALLLLGGFSAIVAFNLWRKRTPNCNCFGQLHAAPIGKTTLVRNGCLILLAGWLAMRDEKVASPSLPDWLVRPSALESIALLAIGLNCLLLSVMGWLVFRFWKQQGRMLARISVLERGLGSHPAFDDARHMEPAVPALPLGMSAPDFALPGVDGYAKSLASFLASGKPVVLLFVSPHCGPCIALLPEVERWQRNATDATFVLLMSQSDHHAGRQQFAARNLQHVLLQKSTEVADLYQVSATPAAILVRANRTIGSEMAFGSDNIHRLVARLDGNLSNPEGQDPAAAGQAFDQRIGDVVTPGTAEDTLAMRQPISQG
jgi:thiol-disulfide isomerase/thioredoxin